MKSQKFPASFLRFLFIMGLSASLFADDDKGDRQKKLQEVQNLRDAPAARPSRPNEQKRQNVDRVRDNDQPRQRVISPKDNEELRRKAMDQRNRPVQPKRGNDSQPNVQRVQQGDRNRDRNPGQRRIDQKNRDALKREAKQLNERRNLYRDDYKNRSVDDASKRSYRDRVRDNRDRARSTSSEIRKRYPGYRHWFNNDFFRRRNYYPSYWDGRVDWWRGAGWGRVHRWLGWRPTIYPVYYYNGTPMLINFQVENNYIQDRVDVPDVEEGEWLPLGVYVVSQDSSSQAQGNIFLQLAIDRDGDLAGTYYNSTTDESHAVEGFIDSKTQLAYWRQVNNVAAPLMSTGLYNLTQDVADVQLTFPSGSVQVLSLIRLQEQ